jgi:hypothetical protein
MIEALLKLHVEPGINPHNGAVTTKIELITVQEPFKNKYWWTSVDLSSKKLEKAAEIIDFDLSSGEIIFASKKYVYEFRKDIYCETTAEYCAESGEEINKETMNKKINKIKNSAKAYLHPKYKYLIKNMKLTHELV